MKPPRGGEGLVRGDGISSEIGHGVDGFDDLRELRSIVLSLEASVLAGDEAEEAGLVGEGRAGESRDSASVGFGKVRVRVTVLRGELGMNSYRDADCKHWGITPRLAAGEAPGFGCVRISSPSEAILPCVWRATFSPSFLLRSPSKSSHSQIRHGQGLPRPWPRGAPRGGEGHLCPRRLSLSTEQSKQMGMGKKTVSWAG
ncbi:hypothetical protein Acr_08g0010750 [Actinidia rufa]|uniref:Uncharacterized protein n=1 Tax=Actinidia rufa TaxID=165716 RepID=A0A7J0F384_9ERIC|nr:hypothetical protein Acr_08g0010750 [Actinidia rufa]